MSKYLGDVSAYAYAVSKGYTGTEEEFAELMASYASVAEAAAESAQAAASSASDANASKIAAGQSEANAAQSAEDADDAKTAAINAKDAANGIRTEVEAFKTAASGSASQASQSAAQAANSAQSANLSATDANTAKTDAETAQTKAETAQGKAETAQGKAEEAQSEAEQAAQSISESAEQIETNKENIEDMQTVMERKANIDGYYKDLTSGDSEQLISTVYVDDDTPYLFRTAGGSADIGDRAYVDAVVGGSVVWNQLANFSILPTASNGITYSSADGKSVTFSGTANAVEQRSGWFGISEAYLSTRVEHNILMLPKIIGGSLENGTITYSLFATAWRNFSTPCIVKVGESQTRKRITTNVESGTVANDFTVTFICADLTAMFGSTIADYLYSLEQATPGAGVAWFRQYFPNDFYPHNPGEIQSVSGVSAKVNKGFNAWDEEWELGRIDPSTGTNANSRDNIRSKNYIRVLPNTSYYINVPYKTGVGGVYYYDSNHNYINSALLYMASIKTTPNNACYMRFVLAASYGTVYKNDICINLSWDGEKDGTYEPYVEHVYPLDSSLTLRGIPKLVDGKLTYDGDRYLPDGTVERRYGVVDLGTLTWSYSNSIFRGNFTAAKRPTSQSEKANVICKNYISATRSSIIAGTIGVTVNNDDGYIWIRDSAYTDAADFKTAMSGVYLVYELAEPTTETATPYNEVQIVDDFGTEEFISTGIIPVGHETQYPPNLRAKIETAPDSPHADGVYIVQRSGGQNTYIPLGSSATIQDILTRLAALEGNANEG